MAFLTEQPLDTLLKQPRTVMFLLEMYEGLAQFCDQLLVLASSNSLEPSAQAQLNRYRTFYVKRVGVDVTHRDALRQEADKIIQDEISALVPQKK